MKVHVENGESFPIEPGETVLEAARRANIYIKSICRGQAQCAECRIYVKSGETNCFPILDLENQQIGSGYFLDGRRLSCQLKIFGDITIDLTEQKNKQNASFTKDKKSRKALMQDRVEDETAVRPVQRSESEDPA